MLTLSASMGWTGLVAQTRANPTGGQVVAVGPPEKIADVEASHTGRALRHVLATGRAHAYAER